MQDYIYFRTKECSAQADMAKASSTSSEDVNRDLAFQVDRSDGRYTLQLVNEPQEYK